MYVNFLPAEKIKTGISMHEIMMILSKYKVDIITKNNASIIIAYSLDFIFLIFFSNTV